MSKRSSRLGSILVSIALLAVLSIGFMIFGARVGLWEPIDGFLLVRSYLNLLGYTVLGLGFIGILHQLMTGNNAGLVKAAIASCVGLGLLAPMLYSIVTPAKRFPPIHDITTDTDNAPLFLFLNEQRAGAKNSLIYAGDQVAKQQLSAFPDIKPIYTQKNAKQAFAEALTIVKQKGWQVVAQDVEQLHIEAIARTPVYHFVDDVVIVLTPLANGSKIDIRSVSRIGRGDRGVNAARIRNFIAAFHR